MVYTKPQQRREKYKNARLREERGQIKFIDLSFARWQVVGWDWESKKEARRSINYMFLGRMMIYGVEFVD